MPDGGLWLPDHDWGALRDLLGDVDRRLRASERPQFVTQLPAVAEDGQEVYVRADANGRLWRLRYNAASSSAYKWEHVGGSALNSETVAQESFNSSSYGGPTATAQTQVTLPFAGDYEASFGITANTPSTAYVLAALKRGSVAASDADAVASYLSFFASLARTYVRTASAAGEVWQMLYRSSVNGTAVVAQARWLAVRPIRLG